MLVEEQAALNRVAVTVATETAAERVFDVVTEEVARLLGADAANLVRFGPTPDEGVIVGKWSEPGVPIPGAGTIVAIRRRRARQGRADGRAGSAGHGRPRRSRGAPRAAGRARRDVRRSALRSSCPGTSGAPSSCRSRASCSSRRTPRSDWGSSPASSRSRSRTPRPVRSSRLWPTSRPPSAGSRSPLRPRRTRSGSSTPSRRRSAGCSARAPLQPCATSEMPAAQRSWAAGSETAGSTPPRSAHSSR